MSTTDIEPGGRSAAMLRSPNYVLGQLYRQTREAIEARLRGEGLSLRDYSVLVCIDELPRASQQQIADRARIDRSDLVKVLDRLQAAGLVARERDPQDRRRHVLALTAQGRRTLRRALAVGTRESEAAFGALTEHERETLHRLALKALGEDPELAGARSGAR